MTVWSATCDECPDEFTDPDRMKVSEWAEDHKRTERHRVTVERGAGGVP